MKAHCKDAINRPDFHLEFIFALDTLQEKGTKAKLILQVRDENQLLQVETLAQREGEPFYSLDSVSSTILAANHLHSRQTNYLARLQASCLCHASANDALAGLPTFKVKEQTGNARVAAVLAIGPDKSSRIRSITSDLKMVA